VVSDLWRQLGERPGATVTIDLENQVVVAPDGRRHAFDIDPTRKKRLLLGLDDIGVTLQHSAELEAFENRHRQAMTWLAPII
jgi:3-isopropylmalate/(R)-2-methylmalate dehydratase small subunit